MKTLKNKGFSMVELLAVITIIGVIGIIGIVSVSKLIDSSRKHYYETQQNNIVMAAQSYANDNKAILPKNIGEKTSVTLETLIQKKYLTSKIVDQSKSECDPQKSKVDIFKSSQSDYIYNGYLDCPACRKDREKCYGDEENKVPSISITIPTNNKGNNLFLESTKIKIEIRGNSTDSTAKVASYSYKIYVDGNLKKSSGIKINNKKNYVKIEKDQVAEFVPGIVKVVVTATNSYGKTVTKSDSEDLSDISSPNCGYVTYEGDNKMKDYESTLTGSISCGTTDYPWLNLDSDIDTRQAWLLCKDFKGMGCAQHEFSSYMDEDGENQDVLIYDAKNNKTTCKIKKCRDLSSPLITVKLSNGLTFTLPEDERHVELEHEYEETYDPWLNGNMFPSGVGITVTADDGANGSKIKSFSWKMNPAGQAPGGTENLTESVISNGSVNAQSYSASTRINADGARRLEIIATDYAGNKITYYLNIKIDLTKPSCKTTSFGDECKGGVSYNVECDENFSGLYNCAGQTGFDSELSASVKKTGQTSSTSWTVIDVAGNSNSCSQTVYSQTQWRKRFCNTGQRCAAAGVEEYNTCTSSSCCGLTSVTSCSSCGSTCTAKDDKGNCTSTSCNTCNVAATCTKSCCGVKLYNRDIKKCGCASWNAYSDWSWDQLTCSGYKEGYECQIDTRLRYRTSTEKCPHDDPPIKTITVTFKRTKFGYNKTTKKTCSYDPSKENGCKIKAISYDAFHGATFLGWIKGSDNDVTEKTDWKPGDSKTFTSDETYYDIWKHPYSLSSTGYYELKTAFKKASSGETIKLNVNNYEDTFGCDFNQAKTVYLKFGSYTAKYPSTLKLSNKSVKVHFSSGTLKIKDHHSIYIESGTAYFDGATVYNTSKTDKELVTEACRLTGSNATAILSSGTLKSGMGSDSGYARGVYIKKGTFKMTGGKIEVLATKNKNCKGGTCWGATGINNDGGSVVFSGGKVITKKSGAHRCTLCVNNGTFKVKDSASATASGHLSSGKGQLLWVASGEKMCIENSAKKNMNNKNGVKYKSGDGTLTYKSSC